MKILLLNFKWFTINKSVYTPLSENKEKRAEIVWFGFVSERSFRLKTTLHRGGGGLNVNVWKMCILHDWVQNKCLRHDWVGRQHLSNLMQFNVVFKQIVLPVVWKSLIKWIGSVLTAQLHLFIGLFKIITCVQKLSSYSTVFRVLL